MKKSNERGQPQIETEIENNTQYELDSDESNAETTDDSILPAVEVPQEETVNINGAIIPVSVLNPELMQMIALYREWDTNRTLQISSTQEAETHYQSLRKEVLKFDAALKGLSIEIIETAKKHHARYFDTSGV